MHWHLTKHFKNVKLHDHPAEFELGKTLKGVVVDWSDAEINGLGQAVGRDTATKLLSTGQDHGREFGIVWQYLPVKNLGRSICMHLLLHIFKNFPLAAM